MKTILCLGGGFAGMWAALAAAREVDGAGGGVRVVLVSRDAYLTLRPRLYEPEPATLRTPLAPVLGPAGVEFVEGNVSAIDASGGRVVLATAGDGETSLAYDRLVLASGSVLAPLAIPGAAEQGWNIDGYDAALAFDGHLKRLVKAVEAPGRDTFVILGAGFTGIELACEMRGRLALHGGEAAAKRARVVLVDRAGSVGPELGAGPRPVIEAALAEAGVETRLGAQIGLIEVDGVEFGDGERLAAATTVLTPGMRASPLTALLPAPRDELGRLHVDDVLRVEGVPGIFAAGDVARARVDGEHVALMSCQHAMPMGRVAGHNAARELLGLSLAPYRQERYVTCLDLGSAGAVFTTGWQRQVQMTGAEAKARKQAINRERIYPPQGDRAAILAAAAAVPPG